MSRTPADHERPRIVVVSHSCVLAVNQEVYVSLAKLGWDVTVLVPGRWPSEYRGGFHPPETARGLEQRVHGLRVLLAGRPARHAYVGWLARRLRRLRLDVLLIEQEPFVVSAFQWAWAAHRARVPYGVTQYENLTAVDKTVVVRRLKTVLLRNAAFVVARSPAAMNLTRSWGARGPVEVIPPALARSVVAHRREPRRSTVFSVGFAGRLVPEKGVLVLLESLRQLAPPLQLLVIGDGPLRGEVEKFGGGGYTVQVTAGVRHDDVARHLDQLDVLCLPSLTTARWAEQFGRVLTEATALGVPVIGSDSGEIPWVIEQTGGGLVVPEGDANALAAAIARLRDDDALRRRLGEEGRRTAIGFCSADACAARLNALLEAAVPRLRSLPFNAKNSDGRAPANHSERSRMLGSRNQSI